MDPADARKVLIAQHEKLRAHLSRCSSLASLFRAGEPVLVELDASLSQLRVDFAQHNATETRLVRPLLHDSPGWGTVLIDRMLEEHVAEHAAFWESLAGTVADVAAHMDDLIEELDAHMAAEERTFLSPLVLHHEVIARNRKQEV